MALPLIGKTNVEAVSTAYPYGNIKDNTGSNNGTPVNKSVYADFHQFFARIFGLSGLTYNNIPDNLTNGFQYVDALNKLFGGPVYTTIPTVSNAPSSVTLTIGKFELLRRGNLVSLSIAGGMNIVTAGGLNTGSGFVTWDLAIPSGFEPDNATLGGGIAFASQSSAPYKPGQVYMQTNTGTSFQLRFNAIQSVVAGDAFTFVLNITYKCTS